MNIVWAVFVVVIVLFGFVVIRGAPYVPSHSRYVRQAFTELYPISKSDTLVDIGSGDGVVLRTASKLGATTVGFELNPILFAVSGLLSLGDRKVTIKLADIWLSHLPKTTTVVYLFSTSSKMAKTKKWLQTETNRIGREVYLISYGFEFSETAIVKNVGAYHLYKFSPLQIATPTQNQPS